MRPGCMASLTSVFVYDDHRVWLSTCSDDRMSALSPPQVPFSLNGPASRRHCMVLVRRGDMTGDVVK
jgi:hypothetical protein